MKQLWVADLLANSPIDPESLLNPTQVERYARMLEALPPVVVCDTPEGLLVVDGYHRLAAVRRCGLETVEAEVRSGSRRCSMRRGLLPPSAVSPLRRWPLTSSSDMPMIAAPVGERERGVWR